jgi:hypothetical protein
MADGKTLNQSIQEALYGADPTQQQLIRERMKAELDRIKTLVDAGRLGCIIVTELLNDDATQVRSVPYGDRGLVLQTVSHILSSLGVKPK